MEGDEKVCARIINTKKSLDSSSVGNKRQNKTKNNQRTCCLLQMITLMNSDTWIPMAQFLELAG